jgi:hypothetical protein
VGGWGIPRTLALKQGGGDDGPGPDFDPVADELRATRDTLHELGTFLSGAFEPNPLSAPMPTGAGTILTIRPDPPLPLVGGGNDMTCVAWPGVAELMLRLGGALPVPLPGGPDRDRDREATRDASGSGSSSSSSSVGLPLARPRNSSSFLAAFPPPAPPALAGALASAHDPPRPYHHHHHHRDGDRDRPPAGHGHGHGQARSPELANR